MKKAIFLGTILLIGSAILTTSCKKQEAKEEKADSTAVNAQQQEVKKEEPTPAQEEQPEYASIDLQTYNLRGQVKMAQQYFGDEKQPYNVQGFDKAGRITEMTGFAFEGPVTVKYIYKGEDSYQGDFKEMEGGFVSTNMERDKQNRLTDACCMGFTYASDGKLKEYCSSGWESATTYKQLTFDDKGNILTAKYEGEGEGMEWKGDRKIKYTKFDEKGNWTEREITETMCEYDYDGTPGEPSTTTHKERQTITYYE